MKMFVKIVILMDAHLEEVNVKTIYVNVEKGLKDLFVNRERWRGREVER